MPKKPFRVSDCARSSVEKRINLYGGPGFMTGAANSLLALLWAPRFRDVDPVKQLLGCDEARYTQAQECGIRISPGGGNSHGPGPMVMARSSPLARSG